MKCVASFIRVLLQPRNSPSCAAVFATTQPPQLSSPQCEILAPPQFEAEVHTPKAGPWLVMCSAPWSTSCSSAAATFYAVARDFSKKGVRFGEVSIADWPSLRDQLKVCLSNVATSSRLLTCAECICTGGSAARV